jgi:hypothetical protein
MDVAARVDRARDGVAGDHAITGRARPASSHRASIVTLPIARPPSTGFPRSAGYCGSMTTTGSAMFIGTSLLANCVGCTTTLT